MKCWYCKKKNNEAYIYTMLSDGFRSDMTSALRTIFSPSLYHFDYWNRYACFVLLLELVSLISVIWLGFWSWFFPVLCFCSMSWTVDFEFLLLFAVYLVLVVSTGIARFMWWSVYTAENEAYILYNAVWRFQIRYDNCITYYVLSRCVSSLISLIPNWCLKGNIIAS